MNALASVVSRRLFLQASLSASGALVLAPALGQAAGCAAAPPENPLGVLIRIEPDNRVVIGATRRRDRAGRQDVAAHDPRRGAGCRLGAGLGRADADDDRLRRRRAALALRIPGRWRQHEHPRRLGGTPAVRRPGPLAVARRPPPRSGALRWTTVKTAAAHALHPDGRRLPYGGARSCGREACAARRGRAAQGSRPSTASSASRGAWWTPRTSSPAARATASTSSEPEARVAVMLRCPYFDGDIASLDDSRGARRAGRARGGRRAGPEAGRADHDQPRDRRRGGRRRHLVRAEGPQRAEGRVDARAVRGRVERQRSMRSARRCSRRPARWCATTATSTPRRAMPPRSSRRATAIPFVSHAPLEAPCAFVHVMADRARVVAALQQPGGASRAVQRGDRHPARRDQRRDDARGRRLRPAAHQRLRRGGGATSRRPPAGRSSWCGRAPTTCSTISSGRSATTS